MEPTAEHVRVDCSRHRQRGRVRIPRGARLKRQRQQHHDDDEGKD
jgi:hypothetical protein